MRFKFLLLSPLLFLFFSCSKEDNSETNPVERPSEWTLQLPADGLQPNSMAGRLINPQYQFTFFTNSNVTSFKSYIYKSGNVEFQILYPNADTNNFFAFPIEDNEISPFGFEFIINNNALSQVNLVEYSPSLNKYEFLTSIYTSSNFNELFINSASQSSAKSASQSSANYRMYGDDSEDNTNLSLSEMIKDVVDTLRKGTILEPVFDLAEELAEQIEKLPTNIKKRLEKWESSLKGLIGDINQSLKDLTEFEEEKSDKNTIKEDLNTQTKTQTESKVEDMVKNEVEFQFDLSNGNFLQFDRSGVILKFPKVYSDTCTTYDYWNEEPTKSYTFSTEDYNACHLAYENSSMEERDAAQEIYYNGWLNNEYFFNIVIHEYNYNINGVPSDRWVSSSSFRHPILNNLNEDWRFSIERDLYPSNVVMLKENEVLIKFDLFTLKEFSGLEIETYETMGTLYLRVD